MKFIKIDDRRLKIVLPKKEFEELERAKDIDEVFDNPEACKRAIMGVLEEANYKTGYDAEGYKVKITGKETANSLLFIVTKLCKINDKKSFKEFEIYPQNEIYSIDQKYDRTNKEYKTKLTDRPKEEVNAVYDEIKKAKVKRIEREMNNIEVKKIRPKRIGAFNDNEEYVVYRFEELNDFIDFCKQLKLQKIESEEELCKKSELFKNMDKYYLAITNLNTEYKKIDAFYTNITEFSTDIFTEVMDYYIIRSKGERLIKKNALMFGSDMDNNKK